MCMQFFFLSLYVMLLNQCQIQRLILFMATSLTLILYPFLSAFLSLTHSFTHSFDR